MNPRSYQFVPRLPGFTSALLLAALLSTTASAEHEADHRYIVEGYVLDARENPKADVKVAVTAEEGLLGEDVTDRRGFYRIRLHLHNPDPGKSLNVKAGEREAEIEVTLDRGDREQDRIHDLNFIGAATTEVDLGSRGFPAWAYVVIGMIILFMLARTISRALKQRSKAQMKQALQQTGTKHEKAKRKQRR